MNDGPIKPLARRNDEDDFDDDDEGSEPADGMQELLADTKAPKDPAQGASVTGRIVQIGAEDVFLDIGAKSEAVIARNELANDAGELEVAVGDNLEATVVSVADGIRVSRRLGRGSSRDLQALSDAYAARIPVEGHVESVRKGGLSVKLGAGTIAFCPLSQMDIRRIEDPETMVGRTLEFSITELSPDGRNVLVSRRRLLEEQAAKQAEQTRKQLVEGAVLEGEVVTIKDYGAFIELGGLQGLVHISEMSHSRLGHPSEVLEPGDRVKVQVLKLDPSSNKISLGMRQLLEDPWSSVQARLQPGQRLSASVKRVVPFGAFVELLPGVEGLLHVSELAPGRKGADARKYIEEGAEVAVEVQAVDAAKRRIALAAVAEGDSSEPQQLAQGALAKGQVDRIESYGIFVRLGPGKTGLVPLSELGTGPGKDPKASFKLGQELEVQILETDPQGRLRLSIKSAQSQRERQTFESYKTKEAGSDGFSTMADALRGAIEKEPGPRDQE